MRLAPASRVLLSAAVAAAALSCGRAPESEARVRHLRVVIQPFLGHAPIVVGVADSVFAKYGLDIELVPMTRTNDGVPLLINGDIDVLPGSAVPALLNAAARGIAVRMVANRGFLDPSGCTFETLMVPKGRLVDGRLRRPIRRISIERQASYLYIIDAALRFAGVSLSDLDELEVPPAAELDALRKGTIDAAFVGEPWLARALARDVGDVWVRTQNAIPNAETGFVWFGPNLLVKDREAGRRFMLGYREALDHYLQGKTDRNVRSIAKFTGDADSLVRASCWPSVRPDGRVNVSSLTPYQEWAVARHLIDAPLPADRLYDSTFVAYADSVRRHLPNP